MSIQSFNTKGPLSPAQSQNLATAREVKKNVLNAAKRFQSLDGQKADAATDKDVVVVTNRDKADLPHSTGNKLARLAVGVLAPKESEAKVSGYSRADEKGLLRADIMAESQDGKTSEILYERLEDGSEVFHGPTPDGYAVIKENKKDGTLMMMTTDKPAVGAFYRAESWAASPGDASTAEKTAPKTFADTLRDLAGGQQAEGIGTNAGPLAQTETAPQAPAHPPKQAGFLAPFGQTKVSDTIENAKAGGEKLYAGASETVKDAGKKLEEASKSTTQSVKDWTQTETAEKIGGLLFGKLNPFGKKG